MCVCVMYLLFYCSKNFNLLLHHSLFGLLPLLINLLLSTWLTIIKFSPSGLVVPINSFCTLACKRNNNDNIVSMLIILRL